jgi:biopolymer transport protein ExbD
MLRVHLLFLLFACVTFACDSQTTAPASAASTPSATLATSAPSGTASAATAPLPATAAPTCDQQTADLERWIADYVAEGDAVLLDLTVKPPQVDHKPNGLYLNDPAYLAVSETMILFNGVPVGRTRDITDRLVSIDELGAALKKGNKANDIVIQADGRVRWAAVASAAAIVAEAGHDSLIFVFAPRKSMAKPESDLFPQQLDPSKKAPLLGDQDAGTKRKIFAECPEAQAAASKAAEPNGGLTPRQVVEQFGKLLPPSIRACQCRVNMQDVRALIWGFQRWSDQVAYAVRIPLAKRGDQKAAVISDAPDATWANAHTKILALSGSKERHVFEVGTR